MNNVTFLGRMTKDPEVRYTSSTNPMAVSRITIAVDRKFAKENGTKTDFFNCVTFGKLAEAQEKYYKKGMKIIVRGRMQNESYEKDGKKVYYTELVVEECEIVESRKNNEANSNNQSTTDGFTSLENQGEEIPFYQ